MARNRFYEPACPGCGMVFRTKSATRRICSDCRSDRAKMQFARAQRQIALEDEKDAAIIKRLEADKRPVRRFSPATAESIIARALRGGL